MLIALILSLQTFESWIFEQLQHKRNIWFTGIMSVITRFIKTDRLTMYELYSKYRPKTKSTEADLWENHVSLYKKCYKKVRELWYQISDTTFENFPRYVRIRKVATRRDLFCKVHRYLAFLPAKRSHNQPMELNILTCFHQGNHYHWSGIFNKVFLITLDRIILCWSDSDPTFLMLRVSWKTVNKCKKACIFRFNTYIEF